jgi:hypothetical protein
MGDEQATILEYAGKHNYLDLQEPVSFLVQFNLAKPYAGSDAPHLDALLQSAVVLDALQGTQLAPQSKPYQIPIPLEIIWLSPNGLPLYNSTDLIMPLDGRAIKGVSWWVKAVGDVERYGPMIERKRDGGIWQPDEGSGANKAYRVPLVTTQTPYLIAFGRGDVQEVIRLLKLIQQTGISKKRNVGFGQILDIKVDYPLPDGSYLPMFIKTGGKLLRPVPIAALPELGLEPVEDVTDIIQQIAFTPPYWLPANQTQCVPTGTKCRVVNRKVNEIEPEPTQTQSLTDFLLHCQLEDQKRRIMLGDIPDQIVFGHSKYQPGKGIDEPCAVTGFPITEGAVPLKAAISSNMGNVVDFLRAGNTSEWVSNSAAVVMSLPKQWHRNFVALTTEKESVLLWPTLAVDPTNPTQDRPLWREVWLQLSEKYQGYSCVILSTTDPKSRYWPRCRVGRVGKATPVYIYDPDLGISTLCQIDTLGLARQLLFIEKLLEYGFGKEAIRRGLFANLEKAQKHGLSATKDLERELAPLRATAEFTLAWRSARTVEDLKKRKGDD